jgi:sulfate permease, SulP family
VNGPLFFGAAEAAMDAFKAIGARMRVLILYMAAVPAMDITGLVALESTLLRLRQQGVLTLITGVRPQPEGVLRKAGVQEELGRVQFCATLEEATSAAAAHVARPAQAHARSIGAH